MVKNHPWPGIAHHHPYARFHILTVAMHRALAAAGLAISEWAIRQPGQGILQQRRAIGTQFPIPFPMAAINPYHPRHRLLFPFNQRHAPHSNCFCIFFGKRCLTYRYDRSIKSSATASGTGASSRLNCIMCRLCQCHAWATYAYRAITSSNSSGFHFNCTTLPRTSARQQKILPPIRNTTYSGPNGISSVTYGFERQ